MGSGASATSSKELEAQVLAAPKADLGALVAGMSEEARAKLLESLSAGSDHGEGEGAASGNAASSGENAGSGRQGAGAAEHEKAVDQNRDATTSVGAASSGEAKPASGPKEADVPGGWVERLRALDIDGSLDRLTEADSIYEFLDAPHLETGLLPIRLVRLSWILERAEQLERVKDDPEQRKRLALPRRQEVPEAAFISGKEVKRLQKGRAEWFLMRAAIIAVSYCWRTPEHPDPLGETLLCLAAALREAKRNNAEKRWPEEAGVFVDWTCCFQKKAGAPRSPDEQTTFKFALDNLDLIYSHGMPTTIMLTDLATERPYHQRGWPCFEFSVSCLVKSTNICLWDPAIHAGAPERNPLHRVPMDPDAFADLMADKPFMNGKSERDVVLRLYDLTVARAFRGAKELGFAERPWSEEDMEKFLPLLQLADRAVVLSLYANAGLRGRGLQLLVDALRRGALPGLRDLNVGKTGLGAGQLDALLRAAPQQLQALTFSDNPIGPEGLEVLLGALRRGALPSLNRLWAGRCGLGGGADLGALLRLAPAIEVLNVRENSIGLEGFGWLLGALRAGEAPKLRVLDLRDNELDGADYGELVRAAPALQELDSKRVAR